MANKAIIAGSTGLIGSKLLQILLRESFYDEVLILVRKKIDFDHKKLTQLVVNFDQLDSYADTLTGHALFSCLGTTNAKTPDKTVYRHIDHDYPVQLAQLALKNGIGQYHLVSSIGADPGSSFFYTKTKGETEADIRKLGLPKLYIYRPSMLTGNRQEKRSMEKALIAFYKIIDPLLFGSWKKYRSIAGETVAMAMYKQSTKNNTGTFIYESDQIKQLS
ncbi:NAD(P)H-binding protein [Mucilaginibacter sp. KACC 22773]|uniref:NAD(P)H-binding protein n=1 Tax=Mucilaginibacter sp. KACC 22773 TaxID=3025671 RepID=UPI0023655EAA|nr:NAD(P)H-binding protein [Mucilaginibacter sp. KACC 22773]WDF78008.1 NAD(P)H-binding protein [Mucilaginibacter sp. KACC 22773]